MIAVCPAAAPGAAFARRMLDFVDCQAQAIGAGGYQALAAAGSTLSLALTGFLTLFVAFFGYRLLFGHAPSVREGVLALVKIGVVLALATSWTAYRTLIYDVALKGPAELAAEVSRPAALPGAGGGLVAHIDYTDRALAVLAVLGPGSTAAAAAPPAAPPYLTPGPATGVPPPAAAGEGAPGPSGFDGTALAGARILFLAGALGAIALVRLVAGLLLALGPFFIAFLLFESTRGLFEGWLRVLAGTALGAIGTAVVLGVELALLEPWLADLLARRYAGLPIPGAPVELFVATLLFGLVLIGTLYASARVALGFRLPPAWRSAPAQLGAALRGEQVRFAAAGRDEAAIPVLARSRAATVADAVAASQRREAGPAPAAVAGAAAAEPFGRTRPQGPARDVQAPAPPPLGRSFRRRTTSRVSASAGRRDLAS